MIHLPYKYPPSPSKKGGEKLREKKENAKVKTFKTRNQGEGQKKLTSRKLIRLPKIPQRGL
jgi:hypothetical protein